MTNLSPAIQEKLESPKDEQVNVLVGISGSTDSAIEAIRACSNAEIDEELPYDLISLFVSERSLKALCELEAIESIELNSTGHQMSGQNDDTGNSKFLPASIP